MVRPSERNDYGEWIPHIEGKKTLYPLTEFEYDEWEKMEEMKTYTATITETFKKRILVKAPNREEANRLLDAAWYGDLHTESCNKVLFDYHDDDSDHTMYLDEEITENLPEEYEDLEVLELNPDRDNFAWRTN